MPEQDPWSVLADPMHEDAGTHIHHLAQDRSLRQPLPFLVPEGAMSNGRKGWIPGPTAAAQKCLLCLQQPQIDWLRLAVLQRG